MSKKRDAHNNMKKPVDKIIKENALPFITRVTYYVLTWWEKIKHSRFYKAGCFFYKVGRRSIFVNSLRVILLLLLIVAVFFRYVAPRKSLISLSATWDKIDQIDAQRISKNIFEADSIHFSNFDALTLSLEKNYSVVYNNVEYDNSYTFVFRPGSYEMVLHLQRSANSSYIKGWQLPFRNSPSDAYKIPKPINEGNKVKISGDFIYEQYYYDIGLYKNYNLTISNNEWGTCYNFERNEPCYLEGYLCFDIYKNNELIIEGKEDGYNYIEIPMLRGVIITTYGQGNMYLSKVQSFEMEINCIERIAFTGSGSLQ